MVDVWYLVLEIKDRLCEVRYDGETGVWRFEALRRCLRIISSLWREKESVLDGVRGGTPWRSAVRKRREMDEVTVQGQILVLADMLLPFTYDVPARPISPLFLLSILAEERPCFCAPFTASKERA